MSNTLDHSTMSSDWDWSTDIWYDETDSRCQTVIELLGYWVHQYHDSYQDDWIAKAEQAGDYAGAARLRHQKATIGALSKTTQKELDGFTAAVQQVYGYYHKPGGKQESCH